MSWTDVFPVLTDDHLDAYDDNATPAERAELDGWFAVERVINRSNARHLVVFSLFWKNTCSEDPDLPPLNRETLMRAAELGLVTRFAPWEHYIQPLLNGAQRLRELRSDVAFRIYLAADLHFLIQDFTALGCEVVLMKSSSVRHNPGAMWRFLALEEKRKLITISDSDRAPLVEADIQRTELMALGRLGFWRVPVWGERNEKGLMGYRPVLGCQFGTNKPFPAGRMMKSLIWHTTRGSISTHCRPPGCGEQRIYGTQWPDYGFDEWFLQVAIYPRAARHGVLSFIPASARSQLLPIDIEYCTWANPRAEITYFGTDGSCCGDGTNTHAQKNIPIRVRRDCTVIIRNRKRTRSAPPRFTIPRPCRMLKASGDLFRLLTKATKVRTHWLVDIAHDLEPGNAGAELFLDRRFESADLVVTGWRFLQVTGEVSEWAAAQGCRGLRWKRGAALKVPKLDAPLTLWRTEFANKVASMGGSIDPALQIAAWFQTGEARIMEARIKPQGWNLTRPEKL
jgi:hypothetical protein